MDKTFTQPKIKVLLIDDEPTYGLINGEKLAIYKPEDVDGFDDIGEYFELCWIRTTEDAKQYMDYLKFSEIHAGRDLLNYDVFIPEIVGFDYSLDKGRYNSESFTEHYENNPFDSFKTLFAKYNITTSDLPAVGDQPELTKKKESASAEKPADLLGCICGGLLLLQLKDYPVVGVPTTKRTEKDVEGTTTEVFEWLINFDLKGVLNSKNRQEAMWHKILGFGCKNLRERIKFHVSSGKLIPDLAQLLDFDSDLLQRRTLSFYTVHGTRVFPLDGLFIDEGTGKMEKIPEGIQVEVAKMQKELVRLDQEKQFLTKKAIDEGVFDINSSSSGIKEKLEANHSSASKLSLAISLLENITKRDYEIKIFVRELIRMMETKASLETDMLYRAAQIAEELWSTAASDILKERFILSELFCRKYLAGETLTHQEMVQLQKYCGPDYFGISDCEAVAKKIKNGERVTDHVTGRVCSIKEYHKNGEKGNRETLILAILFLAVRLQLQFALFKEHGVATDKDNSLSRDFIGNPGLKELLYLLFPSPANPVVMMGHLYYTPEKFRKNVIDGQYKKFLHRTDGSGLSWSVPPDDLDFSRIVNSDQKLVCQAYAFSVTKNKNRFPSWIL